MFHEIVIKVGIRFHDWLSHHHLHSRIEPLQVESNEEKVMR